MDWNYSFRAFRLFGTDVRIHWSLPAFFLYYLLRAGQHGYSPTFLLLFTLLPMLMLFASVVAHEYGHVFAARRHGIPTDHMVLTPIGGMVIVAQPRTPASEFQVAIAGPAVNVAIGVVATALYLVVGGPPDAGIAFPFLGEGVFSRLWREGRFGALILHDLAQTNFLLFWFNMLLVAYPMDGGRVLMSWLWHQRGFHGGLELACKVARVLAGGLLLLAIVTTSPMLGVIAFFVFLQASTTLQQARFLPDPSRLPHRKVRGPNGSGGIFAVAPRRPTRLGRWFAARRERKIRSLLARAELHGLDSLSEAERRYLERARHSKNGAS